MRRFAGVTIERDIPCRLRDGVVLFSDVYRPDGVSTDLPVLLMRQPYGKSIASTVTYAHPTWYAKQGFVVVIQDVRGRGASEGKFTPFVQEVEDGYDAVEWVARLAGTNGKVGMYGFSYQGATQWAAAAAHPPSLMAIAPAMCASDLYHGWFYPHGRFALGGQLPWAAQLARDEARRLGRRSGTGSSEVEERLTRIMQNPGERIRHLPLNDFPEIEELAPYYREWVEHHAYDVYWAERNWLPKLMERCPPALHIGGWFDSFLDGTWQSFATLESSESRSRGLHELVIGPWVHIPWGRRVAGVDQGPDARPLVDSLSVRWFNRWLKDEVEAQDGLHSRVRYFELGSKVWREAADLRTCTHSDLSDSLGQTGVWALSGTGEPANGLGGGGILLPQNVLLQEDVMPEGSDVFVYDARLPMVCESYLPVDRSTIQERYEILVYTSPPLDRLVSLCGVPSATLWMDALDGPSDVAVTLTAVSDTGAATFLSIGRGLIESQPGRGEHDDGDLDDAHSDDGMIRPVTIHMRPIAVALQKGFCLRLEVTGSAFPLFARHPNGIEEADISFVDTSRLSIATVSVHYGKGCRSFLRLPLVDDV